MKRLSKCLCVATIISLLAKLILSFGLRSWFIIGFGIRSYRWLSNLLSWICLISAFATILSSLPLMRKAWRERRELKQALAEQRERQRIFVGNPENSDDPESIRQRLELLRQEIPVPEVQVVVEQSLRQMDKMDQLQARQSLLIESNDASFLNETIEVVNKVEKAICRNCQSLINHCIVAGGIRELDSKKASHLLGENERKLEVVEELLGASADWINKYNSDQNADHGEIDHWINALKKTLKEEEI